MRRKLYGREREGTKEVCGSGGWGVGGVPQGVAQYGVVRLEKWY